MQYMEPMTPEERLTRIETQIEKQNEGIQGLIVVNRTMLSSMQELRAVQGDMIVAQRNMMEEVRELNKHTDEKLNILIDTVDRIIRNRNNPGMNKP